MTQGPNVKQLITKRMATIMVPPGGVLADALNGLTKPGNLIEVAGQATKDIELLIQAVRQAAEPNPWKDSTDEEIAGEILKQIQERDPPHVKRIRELKEKVKK